MTRGFPTHSQTTCWPLAAVARPPALARRPCYAPPGARAAAPRRRQVSHVAAVRLNDIESVVASDMALDRCNQRIQIFLCGYLAFCQDRYYLVCLFLRVCQVEDDGSEFGQVGHESRLLFQYELDCFFD